MHWKIESWKSREKFQERIVLGLRVEQKITSKEKRFMKMRTVNKLNEAIRKLL